MIKWWKKLTDRRPPSQSAISMTDDGIILSCPQTLDVEGEIFWRAVTKITYRTIIDDPVSPNWFIHFSSEYDPDSFVVHNEMTGFAELTNRLSQLPGFNSVEAPKALRSTTNKAFVIWEAKNALA